MKRSLLISSAFALVLSPAALASDCDKDRFSTDHSHIDAQVNTSNGDDFGTIERVRFASDNRSQIDAYVVETGGFLEIGGREILINANDAEWTGSGDDRVLTLNYTAHQAASLPDFNEGRATDYWLADANWTEDGDRDNDNLYADKNERHVRTQTAARMDRNHPDENAAAQAHMRTATGYAGRESETLTRMGVDTRNDLGDIHTDWNRNVTAAAWDIEDWTNSTVYLSEGAQLGTVTDVRSDAGGVSSLIVEIDADYEGVEDELEIMIEDVMAVRENGTGKEVQVASSVAVTSGD